MTLATSIVGTETRLRPLIKALAVVTAVRAVWIAINAYQPPAFYLAWALLPWPRHWFTLTVWAIDLALVFFQLRGVVRIVRLLLLRYTPASAALLGLSNRPVAEEQSLTPRHRSWWPTALLLCAIVILSCCGFPWLVLTLASKHPMPFDQYLASRLANIPWLIGLILSILGLTFGRRYIARAAGDVTTRFGVTPVDDSHWLAQRVHALAERLNLPKPAVGVTNVTNAFAMGAKQKSSMVVIGKPLFAFEQDELDAIIGHELGHVLHNDVARMQFAEAFQRVLVAVINVVSVVGAIVAAAASQKRSDANRNYNMALGSGTIARKTIFVASELVAKGISRNREFHADAIGAHVTSADAMARALKRAHGVAAKPTPEERNYGYLMFRGAAFGRFFATHPTLKARLTALDAHAAALAAARPETAAAQGSQGLGLVGAQASEPGSSPAWAGLDSIAAGAIGKVRQNVEALAGKANAKDKT
ncbi:M48 family metalloprotease [Mesorhizobium sp. GbtcB19]|uniref:M48 family metalloprotease n=1 Tax=Mesorhizobium sp. GbtcB19 TaxID=2824764 RepID=UPI001C3085CF|nr:M48 family metalloprotease [Mesorhizobium sp. GbtcB19]